MHELGLLALFLLGGLALLELAWRLAGARRWRTLAAIWLLFSAGYGYLGTVQLCTYSIACDNPGMDYLAKLYAPYAVIGAIIFGAAFLTVMLLRRRGVRSRWPAFLLGIVILFVSRYFAEWLVDPWSW